MGPALFLTGIAVCLALGAVHAALWWRSGGAVADHSYGRLGALAGFGLLAASAAVMFRAEDRAFSLWTLMVAFIVLATSGAALEKARLRMLVRELKAELRAARGAAAPAGAGLEAQSWPSLPAVASPVSPSRLELPAALALAGADEAKGPAAGEAAGPGASGAGAPAW